MSAEVVYIGEVKTPYQRLEDCPSNVSPRGAVCQLHLGAAYEDGLQGLKVGQQILVLYWLDRSPRDQMLQVNVHKSDGRPVGVFSLRSPHRPNPIGAAVVSIESVEGAVVGVRGLDCLDGTPLIDIKPHM